MTHSILACALINMLINTGSFPTDGGWIILIGTIESIPPFTLVPQFILGLRKLYASDLRGRRGSDIDTAFGFTSAPSHGVVASAIMFADAGQNEGLEQGEEIQMEEREVRNAGSGA